MVWNHPEISLEDLMNLLKGFVDMLILASGYQSSGLLAYWDAENIRKCIQWGLFFENVLRSITSSGTSNDSIEELDEAISKMKSNPLFPQGLANLSSATLSRARDTVLEHLINNVSLRDNLLQAIASASVEAGDDVGDFTFRELLKRKSAVSSISTLGTSLGIVSSGIRNSSWMEEQLKPAEAFASAERGQQFVEFSTWNYWKSRSLSYFVSERTVRLVSGASLIFTAPKIQWRQVLGRLHVSSEISDDVLHEKIELLLIGCIAGRWTHVLDHFLSVSYSSVNMSEQMDELCKLLHQTSQSFNRQDRPLSLEVDDILEFLAELLAGQLHQLCKIPPALIAAAIPPWSPLFQFYLGEMDKHSKANFSTTGCCGCNRDGKKQKDCELAERVWCIYIFHVRGFHQIHRR